MICFAVRSLPKPLLQILCRHHYYFTMCIKYLMFGLMPSHSPILGNRKLEVDEVANIITSCNQSNQRGNHGNSMDCEESADAVTEIRSLGRHPFGRQARLVFTNTLSFTRCKIQCKGLIVK